MATRPEIPGGRGPTAAAPAPLEAVVTVASSTFTCRPSVVIKLTSHGIGTSESTFLASYWLAMATQGVVMHSGIPFRRRSRCFKILRRRLPRRFFFFFFFLGLSGPGSVLRTTVRPLEWKSKTDVHQKLGLCVQPHILVQSPAGDGANAFPVIENEGWFQLKARKKGERIRA